MAKTVRAKAFKAGCEESPTMVATYAITDTHDLPVRKPESPHSVGATRWARSRQW